MLWGLVLGYAFYRSGDLWLPIGIHFGWNWALPLVGVRVSGFTMGLTGLAVRWKAGPLWSGGDYGIEGGLPGAPLPPSRWASGCGGGNGSLRARAASLRRGRPGR